VEAGEQAGKPVSICGNLGADPRMLPYLLGIGLRIFSLDPMQIPPVQRRIAEIDLDRARFFARKLLTLGRTGEIADFIGTFDGTA